ncbi:MAG: hypothetical protein RL653_1605 [Pseudomonadota bacterium]|jgi:hypothetical protein
MSARKRSSPEARRAKKALAEGKRVPTAAGALFEKEMHRAGDKTAKRRPRSRAQAIAVGLSEARRAGIPVPPKPAAKKKPAAGGRREAPRAVSNRSAKKRRAPGPRGGKGGRSR